jgi:uncharacterized damage-inducible protein DinB
MVPFVFGTSPPRKQLRIVEQDSTYANELVCRALCHNICVLIQSFARKAQAAMNDGLVDFYKHNLWANLGLLDACAHLTDEQLNANAPGTYGRICDTLVHLFRAEESYLARLKEQEPADILRVGEFPGIAALREHARRSGEELIAIAETGDPARVVRGTYRGEPYELPVMVLLMQAIHHATDHRSQIATAMSQIGMKPPELSVWAYDEAMRG